MQYFTIFQDKLHLFNIPRGTQRQFSENISSEDDLRSRIFGTFVVKFLCEFGACQKLEPAGLIGDFGNFLNGFAY